MRPPGAPPRRSPSPGPGQLGAHGGWCEKLPRMEPVPRSPGPAWPLTWLVLFSLPGVGAQVSPSVQLQQPQDKVSVTAGETLNLTCTSSGSGPAGPLKWLKGWGMGNETVYDQNGVFPRVTRAEPGSNTDFSIYLRDVGPEDAGTYYCVKFRRRIGVDEVLEHGKGTEVSVRAKPTPPVVSGPQHRAGPGQSVSVTCVSGGFYPENITVRWLKDAASISAQQPRVTPGRTKSSYNMSSSVTVTLQEEDVRSQLVCEVQHPTLRAPLRATFQLSKVLRVPPRVRVVAEPPGPVEPNGTVTLSCQLEGFYPGEVSVTWLENGMEMKVENVSRAAETRQGLFELRSQVELQATVERNGSVFTCRVVHDGQEPLSELAALRVTAPAQEGTGGQSQGEDEKLRLIYIVVGVICTVLALLVAATLYLIRAKQSKGKSSPSARLHEPEKSSEATTQESDPNNLTYADLNFDKERKPIRRVVELSQQSDYACIQSSPAPAGDDNLTYADLDMVHLSKAPKRPAPGPEEASSEYASVQIPRK
ncbi:tyrosine-protein phosphatase non-receptor type substrate 1-like isoform X1 [Heliangelus exortis]|uniref:tyrosine-protein phosphatase non-receptor type substrate 1-like isoform X1 n=2 Tax=Heliangelus exortis TaxID=472823 RepID=UPI003A8D7FE2